MFKACEFNHYREEEKNNGLNYVKQENCGPDMSILV